MNLATKRGSVWALTGIPAVLTALVMWAWALPEAPGHSLLLLSGPWVGHAAGGDPDALMAPAVDTSDWLNIRLPGSFVQQGLDASDLILRRTVQLPAEMQGVDLAFVVGYVRDGTLEARVNGHVVGFKGVAARRFLGSKSQQAVLFVPAELTRGGIAEMSLRVQPLDSSFEGISDPRLVLGRYDVVWPWAFHESTVRSAVETGSVLVMVLLAALLTAMWRLQKNDAQVDLYRSTVALAVSTAMYLAASSGFLLPAFLGAKGVLLVLQLSVYAIGASIPEFLESYYLGRTTRFRVANRVVCVAAAVAHVAVTLAAGHTPSAVYSFFVYWLFLLMAYALVVATKDLLSGSTRFGPVALVAIALTVAAGLNDLLCDLDVLFMPRLFTLAVSNLATTAALVVVGEFLKLADDNAMLTHTLGVRNAELATSLVRAEESARVKTEFLAKTSHELRTPLNSIINIPLGLLEQYKETASVRCSNCQAEFELEPGEPFDAHARCPQCTNTSLALAEGPRFELPAHDAARLLRTVVRSGQHLLAVVNDILDYSKIEAGRMSLVSEPIDFTSFFADLRGTLEPLAAKGGVTMVFDLPANPVALIADRVKLQQVLINLVGNAIKFSDGKGTVTVRAAVHGETLFISVADQGIGIAREQQEMIFQGFRQVESGSTRRFGGTGLGLVISRRLIELHGGRLRLESALGQGSTFFIELPLTPDPTKQNEDQKKRSVVLVVDDDVSALDTTALALRPLDVRVHGLRDPRETIAQLRRERPALIVLDVMMPHISGLDVLREVRADRALKDLPVIVSSAYPGSREAVIALGAEFIEKPWAAGELLALATRVIESAQEASS